MGAVIPALIGGLALAVVSSKATPLAPKPTALEWSPVAAGGAGIGAIGKTAGATCVSMKLPDNVKHGAMFVGTDGASSADPLAHCPQPARGEVGKAHSPRVISVKPDYGSPACPPVSFNRALNSPQVIVDETGRLRA